MKYGEAKSKIEDLLESKYGDEWSDHYRIGEWKTDFALSKRDDASGLFKFVLWVSKEHPKMLEVRELGRFERSLADIFMELALTPLEDREEEKKYVVKIWDYEGGSFILVKVHGNGLLTISTTDTVDKRNRQDVEPLYQDGEPSYQFAFTKKEIDIIKDTFTLNIDWDKAVEEYNGEI